MIDIFELFLHHLKTLAIGLFLVILSIFLIPHDWTIAVIRKIKPSLLKDIFKKNDKYFNSILGILLDGTFTDNFKDEEKAKTIILKIKSHNDDLSKIEQNMFTIDLLTDLFNTLSFSAVHYSLETTQDVIDNISNYFSNYSGRLHDTAYRRNFADDILRKFSEMTEKINETKEFESEDKLGDRFTKASRKNYTLEFDRYLKNEKELLKSNRELLTDSIKKNALDLMDEAK